MNKCQIFTILFLIFNVASTAHAEDPINTDKLESFKKLGTQAPEARHLNTQSWETKEGTKVLFSEAHQIPMFDIQLTFAAGSSYDGNKPGLAMLTNAMINEGTKDKNVDAIAAEFDSLGAEFSNGAYRDMGVIGLRSLSDTKKSVPALKLLTEILHQPSFPEDSLIRLKNQTLASLEYQKKEPSTLAKIAMYSKLYGSHPYAHSPEGTITSVPHLTKNQIQAFYTKAYTAKNLVIALTGDLTLEQAKAISEKISTALPQGPALAAIPKTTTPKAVTKHIEFPSNQTHILVAQLGITHKNPNYSVFYLANQILGGGGFGTRLMEELREKRGLTYGIYSSLQPMKARGPFVISMQTRAEQSKGALTLLKQQLSKYIKEGPTQVELDQAKREIEGKFPLATASNASIVGQLGSIGFYGLPLDYLDQFMKNIQATTLEQINKALKTINADDLVIITVGPTVPQKNLPSPTTKKK